MAVGALPMRAQSHGARNRTIKRTILGLLFISPWLVHFFALQLYPFFESFRLSLHSASMLKEPVWLGGDNYVDLLTSDPRFITAIYNTIYYAVGAVGLGTIAAIVMALMLNMNVRGKALYRTIYYLPSVTPAVASAVVFLWLLNPQYGLVNQIMRGFGIPTIGWFSDPFWAKPTLILLHLWAVGGAVVIYLAGLQDIPQELYDAASIDGANKMQQIWNVTLPLLSPVILFNVITGMIGALQQFVGVHILTGGGPADSTMLYGYYLYVNAFQYYKMGYASAMAWLLFLLVMAATLLIFRLSGRYVHYAGR